MAKPETDFFQASEVLAEKELEAARHRADAERRATQAELEKAKAEQQADPLCQRPLRQSHPDIFVPMGGEWFPKRAQATPSSRSRRRPRRGRAQAA
jgi:regulator of protease activity HflC (stomatin/prohibitin superfamily)